MKQLLQEINILTQEKEGCSSSMKETKFDNNLQILISNYIKRLIKQVNESA